MSQKREKLKFHRLQFLGWNRPNIHKEMMNDYKNWWKNIEVMKVESSRDFDKQLNNLHNSWPKLDKDNTPITTGYIPVSVKVRKETLERDHFTCRICCRPQINCIGEEVIKISSWHTFQSINLEAHHIIPLPSGPNISDNLLTLCKVCHEKFHVYLDKSLRNRAVFEAVFWSFHKCLNNVPIDLPIPEYNPILADEVISYLGKKVIMELKS